jgi:hypothetical protein
METKGVHDVAETGPHRLTKPEKAYLVLNNQPNHEPKHQPAHWVAARIEFDAKKWVLLSRFHDPPLVHTQHLRQQDAKPHIRG